MFQRNYETIKEQNIDERIYSIKCNKKLPDDVIKVIDFLANNAIKEVDSPKLFDIYALLYTSVLTAKEYVNDLTELIKKHPKKSSPKWLNNIENKIAVLRKKIDQLTTLINCKTTGNFTNHQKEIKKKFDKKYGNTRLTTLNFNLKLLKQERKATSTNLKWHKKKYERQVINNKFNTKPKSVYRDFKGNKITLTNLPAKHEVEDFWKGIWATETNFNKNAK